MVFLDLRGMECPKPVVETKRSIQEGKFPIKIVVNGQAPKENIARMLDGISADYQKHTESGETEFVISNAVFLADTEEIIECSPERKKEKIFLFKGDFIGADEVLGKKLARGFLKTILNLDTKPQAIFFINSGVKLTTSEETELNETLKNLENSNIDIYSCGVCLEYFGLTDSLKVGKIGNALDTMNSLVKYETVSL